MEESLGREYKEFKKEIAKKIITGNPNKTLNL